MKRISTTRWSCGESRTCTPATASLAAGGGKEGNFEGKNPSHDVALYYFLRDESEEPLAIEILDGDGRVIRRYSSEEGEHERCRIANMDPRRPFEIKYPETKQGLNRWSWNLRSEDIRCIEDIALFAGFNGPHVMPGDYSARLRIGVEEQTVSFSVAADPRSTASRADVQNWVASLEEVGSMMNDILESLDDLRAARDQIEALMNSYPDDASLKATGAKAIAAIGAWEAKITQLKHETYEDEDAWETMLAGQLRYLFDVIDETGAPVTDGAMQRLSDLKAEWADRQSELRSIVESGIRPVNEWARQKGVNHVLVVGS